LDLSAGTNFAIRVLVALAQPHADFFHATINMIHSNHTLSGQNFLVTALSQQQQQVLDAYKMHASTT
jgi:hypothetical protein